MEEKNTSISDEPELVVDQPLTSSEMEAAEKIEIEIPNSNTLFFKK